MKPLNQLVDKLLEYPDGATVGIHPDGDALVVKHGKNVTRLPVASAVELFPKPKAKEPYEFFLAHHEHDGDGGVFVELRMRDDANPDEGKTMHTLQFGLKDLEAPEGAEQPSSNIVRMALLLRNWFNNGSENAWAVKAGGVVAEFLTDLKAGTLFTTEDWEWEGEWYVEYAPLAPKWSGRFRLWVSIPEGWVSSLYLIHRLCSGGESFYHPREEEPIK